MALVEKIVIDLERPDSVPENTPCPQCGSIVEREIAVFDRNCKTEFRKGEIELDIFGPGWECPKGHKFLVVIEPWIAEYDRRLVTALVAAGLDPNLFEEITGRKFKTQRD